MGDKGSPLPTRIYSTTILHGSLLPLDTLALPTALDREERPVRSVDRSRLPEGASRDKIAFAA